MKKILDLTNVGHGEAAVQIADFIGDLTYANYSFNRTNSPEISPERWKKVYGNSVDAMEKRYLSEYNLIKGGQ